MKVATRDSLLSATTHSINRSLSENLLGVGEQNNLFEALSKIKETIIEKFS
jgi:hypothetical protein